MSEMLMTEEILGYVTRYQGGVSLIAVLDHVTKKVSPARTNLPEVSEALLELLNKGSLVLDDVRYLKVVQK